MTTLQDSFKQRLHALASSESAATIKGIQRGVEREALRINHNGKLSNAPHPRALGAALTHDSITTDFSESLLEFITPPETDINVTIEQLYDIHKFVLSHIGQERLWPLSMPCFIDDEATIPLADFGESNVGKMKRIYRVGLKNRYGSMMQAIAGVHYNFSLPEAFWQEWANLTSQTFSQDMVSEQYLGLIRNYRRLCWLIPYLFGASPALCSSFLKGKQHALAFQSVGKGTRYLPYATSLRMSDLGYTNAEQSALKICYNNLDDYVSQLRRAMNTPSSRFAKFASGEEGHFQQLNKNILQIENELYSPIRPKQPTQSLERPTDALVRRGISYVEVRALDVDPFSAVGITAEQGRFLDVFLLTCLLLPSPKLEEAELDESTLNLERIVLRGREPGLMLQNGGVDIAFSDWTKHVFEHFEQVAELFDSVHGNALYSEAVAMQWQKVVNPSLTPSGKILDMLVSENKDNGAIGLAWASAYQNEFEQWHYRHTSEAQFAEAAEVSLQQQRSIEEADDTPFDEFIKAYFAAPVAKKMPD